MGRIASLLGKAAPVVGGYMDYQTSKNAGYDDIHSIANATGSTAGGWAGAEAGGLAGGAIGTAILPGIGTAIGAGIGGIGGAIAGSGIGSWLTGSTDDLIRGKQMQHFDRNGNYLGDDGAAEPSGSSSNNSFSQQPDYVHAGLNTVAGATLLGTGIAAGKNLLQNGVNPISNYQVARGLGSSAPQAAKAVGNTLFSDAGRALTKLPGWGKLLGGAALAYDADQLAGQPIEKGIDSLTNQRTNLDNDPVNRQKQQQLQQLQQDQQNGMAQQTSDAQLQQMNDDPKNRFIQQQTDRAHGIQQQDYWNQYNRVQQDAQEQSRNQLSANLGIGLMNNWNTSAQNVNAAMQTIGKASYL